MHVIVHVHIHVVRRLTHTKMWSLIQCRGEALSSSASPLDCRHGRTHSKRNWRRRKEGEDSSVMDQRMRKWEGVGERSRSIRGDT